MLTWLKAFLLVSVIVGVACAGTAEVHRTPTHGDPVLLEKEGITAFQSGHLERAHAKLTRAVQLDPHLGDAYIVLGIIEDQRRRFAQAATWFHMALRVVPNSESAHYNLALSLLGLHRDQEAAGELRKVLKIDPLNSSALYNLSVILEDENRPAEAIPYLDAARKVAPADAAVLLHLVKDYYATHKSASAVQVSNAYVHSANPNPLVLNQLGIELVRNGSYEQGAEALERARSIAPSTVESAVYLAWAYLGMGNPGKVIELLRPLLSGGHPWQVDYLLGMAYLTSGRYDDAQTVLRRAVALNPDQPDLYYVLGELHLTSENKATQQVGVEEIKKALTLSPHDEHYYATLGRWLINDYEFNPAITLLRQGTSEVPRSAELYVLLGLAEYEEEGSRLAIPAVEEGARLDPNFAPAFVLLGNCYFRMFEYEKAVESFKRARQLTSQSDIVLYDLALTLERLNKTQAALRYARKACDLGPARSVNHYLLGKLNAELGNKTEAASELEECIRLDPNVKYPYYLLARTYEQLGQHRKALESLKKFEALSTSEDPAGENLEPVLPPHRVPFHPGFWQPSAPPPAKTVPKEF